MAEAAAIADWHYEASLSIQNRVGVIEALTQKSLVALARGDCLSAVELSKEACDLAWKHLVQNVHVAEKGAALLLALAAARRDELPEKRPGWRALARGLAEGAIGMGQGPARRAYNLWALGQALSSFEQLRLSRGCFRAAIRSARAHGTRLDEARAHAALGLSYLADWRGGEQRVSHLTIALDGFQACGATAEREALTRMWRARSPRTSPTPSPSASGSGSDQDLDTVVSSSSWSTRMNRAVTGVASKRRRS